MGITAKSKTKSSTENWGMGLLLVFFQEDNSSSAVTTAASTTTTTNSAAIVDKTSTPFSSSSPNNSSKTIKRSNSNNPILTKTQSTISICALLLFLTLLLFTLSTFEPSTTIKTPRRFLSDNNKPATNEFKNHHTIAAGKSRFSWFSKIWGKNYHPKNGTKRIELFLSSFALQGMGKLYSRGTRAMSDILVAHVAEDTNEDEFKLFLRLLHRSGLTSKADVVFIFPSSSSSSRFQDLIQEENDSFLKLVHYYKELNNTSHDSVSARLRFDMTQFVKHGKKEIGEPLWGKRIRVVNNNNNNYNESEENGGDLTRLSYGSVVGFEASELDPENSLAGFLDHVPMSLKRWACYPMLLGRVRRNFKHIMLVDVKKLVLLSDPLSRVRNLRMESVYISTKQESSSSSKHSKRNSDRTQSHYQVNPAILMGGARGIRGLSRAMLTEIVRVAMQHKIKKNLVTESAILSQLVSNGHILKNIDLITLTESIPEASSLVGSNSNSDRWYTYRIIQRSNVNYDLNSIIMKHICSCEVESSVYRDC